MTNSLFKSDCPFEFSLTPRTRIEVGDERITARDDRGPWLLPPAGTDTKNRLRTLNSGPVRAADLFTSSSDSDPNQPFLSLQVLAENRLLTISLPGATLRPTSPFFDLRGDTFNPTQSYRLSRFAHLRTDEQTMLLCSPLAHAELELTDSAPLHALFELRNATAGSTISHDPILLDLVRLLLLGNFLDRSTDGTWRDQQPPLQQWEFHDLLFHTASRVGRHARTVGGSYRFKTKLQPPPPAKSYDPHNLIPLPRANLAWLCSFDVPLTAAIESRRSLRRRGNPLSLEDLGQLLYRTARVRGMFDANGMVCTSRPYPGGGACHELEIYLLAKDCRELTSGLYYYDPLRHALAHVAPQNTLTDRLLADARGACAGQCTPQALFVITARFARLSWKYESIAYATVLKDVGVLYQTMYLVATAMGLAPCALGCGDSDLFSKLIGSDYCEETSVGEFMLNGRI